MAEEKKNRSEELESLDKKINEIINGWNQNPEEIVEFFTVLQQIFLRLFTTQHDAHCSTAKRSFTL